MLKTAKKVDNSLFPGILNIIVLGNILSGRLLWENENFRLSLFFLKGWLLTFNLLEPKTRDR